MKNILFTSLIAVAASVCMNVPSAALAEFKIATIDMARVMNESDVAKSKKAEIDKIIQDAEKKTDAKKKSLSSLQEQLKESNDPKLSEKMEIEAKALERFAQDTREDIRKKVAASSKVLADRANGLVKTYAKKNGYNIVIDKSDKFGSPVLYSEASADITEEIIKEMND